VDWWRNMTSKEKEEMNRMLMMSLGRNDIAPKITHRHSCFSPAIIFLPFSSFLSFPLFLGSF
jgi:hypothetical protein